MKLSIVIPTIEEESVFTIIRRLQKMFANPEIIIVDKSSDEYYNRLLETGCKVIRQTDKGVENAIMQGCKSATGDIIVSIDADGTHSLDGIKKGIKLVSEGNADLVLGNRMDNPEKGSMPEYIKLGNKALSKIYSATYKNNIHDVLTGLFVMSSKAFDSIKNVEPYRAGIAFFAIELAKKGYTVAEVPIYYTKRHSGKSKLAKSKFVYGLGVAGHIVRSARDYSPLLIFGVIGVILILAGLVIGAFVIANYLHTGALTEVGRALIAFMLVTVGFLSVIAGLILDLLLQIARRIEQH